MSWRRKVIGRRLWPPTFALLFEDDLGQDRAGDLFACFGIVDDEILAVLDHVSEVFEGDVGAGPSIVEPTVRVFLDRRWLPRIRHYLL